MPGIPVYEKRVGPPSGTIGVARVNLDQSGLKDLGQGMQSLGGSVGNVVAENQRIDTQKAEEQDVVAASKALSSGDEYWNKRGTELQQTYTVGAPDLTKQAQPEFDKWKNEQRATLKTDKGRQFFDAHADSMRTSLNKGLYNYQDRAETEKVAADNKVGMDADLRVIAANPTRYQDVVDRRIAMLDMQERIPEAKRVLIKDAYKREASTAAEQGAMFKNPADWLSKRLAPPAARTDGGPANPAQAGSDEEFIDGISQIESGGKRYASNGAVVTSPKGAKGEMQVMDATNGDPGYGVTPAKDDSLDERARVGRDYAKAMLREYNGDRAKAAAAYNAGPGAVDSAVAKAKAKGNPDAWLAELPPETQAYVPKALKRGGGTATAAGVPVTGPGLTHEISPDAPETFTNMDYQTQQQMIVQAQNQLRSAQSQQRADADRLMVDINAMHKDGKVDNFNLSPEYFNGAYGVDGPTRYADYQSGRVMAHDIGGFATMPDTAIVANLKASEPVDGAGYAAADARQQIKASAAAQVYKTRQEDPQTFAMQHGLSKGAPLDMSKPETIPDELTKRIGTAKMMADTYGTPYKVLTNGEVSQFTTVLRTMPTQVKMNYLDQIRVGTLSDQRAYMSIMTSIAADSPVTAVAGSMLVKTQAATLPGGWAGHDITVQPRDVAATILEGEAILNPTAADKKQDGRGGKFPMPKENDLQLAFNDTVGSAFRGDAKGYETAYQAYKAYYAGKASRDGIISDALDGSRAKEAVFAITGGVTDYNGNGEVLKPWGMPDDQFKDRVQKSFDQQMAAAGLKGSVMDSLSSYGLQSMGEGKYLVTNGSSYLNGKQGPIVLTVAMNANNTTPTLPVRRGPQ